VLDLGCGRGRWSKEYAARGARVTGVDISQEAISMLERFYLKHSSRLLRLRRVPWLGEVAHRISYRMLPPNRVVWVQVRKGSGEGLWMKLSPRTGGHYYEGQVERGLQDVVDRYVRPGTVFYDLGANLGFFTLLAARKVGNHGRVVSFEADTEVAERLSENVEKNAFHNVQLFRGAVWSSTGCVAFRRADEARWPDRGCGRVVSREASNSVVTVASVALDDFAQAEAPPDFVKCDVEGAEYEVFSGARKILAEYRPVVACEVHSSENAAQLTQLFGKLNYSMNWFARNHFLAHPKTARATRPVVAVSPSHPVQGLP